MRPAPPAPPNSLASSSGSEPAVTQPRPVPTARRAMDESAHSIDSSRSAMIFSFDETDYMATTDSSNDRSTGSSWYWSDSSKGGWREGFSGGESSGDSSRKPLRPGTPVRFWRAPQGLVDVGRIPSSESSGRAPTPLPYDRILVLVMVLLGDTICMSVILPFVPFMVEGFLMGPSRCPNQLTRRRLHRRRAQVLSTTSATTRVYWGLPIN